MNRREKILLGTLGAAIVLYLLARSDTGSAFVTDILTSGSRGIRNNNPGNIRKSATVWAGQVPAALQKDASFVIFTAPEFGIRAMAKILSSYLARGVDTVESIIHTWAPPSENDTSAYVAAVLKDVGVKRISRAEFPKLIAAMIKHENGVQPYSPDLIAKGISLA